MWRTVLATASIPYLAKGTYSFRKTQRGSGRSHIEQDFIVTI